MIRCSFIRLFFFLNHRFVNWILYNDWAMFLIWYFEFHLLYILYRVLNHFFLGMVREFERRLAFREHFNYLMNILVITFLVSAVDIFDAFCLLQWSTPFGFFRMSACIMMQRLNNPLVAQSKQHSFNKFPSNDSSKLTEENMATQHGQRSNEMFSKPPPINFFKTDTGFICLYAIVFLVFLVLWSLIGHLLYDVLPLSIKLFLYYESVVCAVKFLVIIITSTLSNTAWTNDTTCGKYDIFFLIKWNESILEHLLHAFRYVVVWFYLGHSFLYSFVDIFIFIKLKTIWSSVNQLTHQLEKFVFIQYLVDTNLVTVHLFNPFYENEREENCHTIEMTSFQQKSLDNQIIAKLMGSSHYDALMDPLPKHISFFIFIASFCKMIVDIFFQCFCYHPFSFFLTILRKFFLIPFQFSSTRKKHTQRNVHQAYSRSSSPRSPYYDKSCLTNKQNCSTVDSFPLCVVCREIITTGKKLPCTHIFHRDCLRQWLESEFSCPVCRTFWLPQKTEKN